MTESDDAKLYKAYLIRVFEERLLSLFAEGKLSGTTHTCIGQELSAVVLADSLDRQRDIMFSNHRCHGHYLAWSDDVDGLLAEVMGKRTGVCGGRGGSQHLCGERFFSNGIQGGIVPVSAGLAFAQKLARQGGIVAACIGDGTLGEGVVYEAFNIAVKWQLPLLVVLENNQVAQSTSQRETLAGDICARAAAFGMRTFRGDTWNHQLLAHEVRRAVALVRNECVPAFVQVDTYRLAAHSKGDDDRPSEELAAYAGRDPVNVFLTQRVSCADARLESIRERVNRAVEQVGDEPSLALSMAENEAPSSAHAVTLPPGTQLEAINRALHDWMAEDPVVILIGEDIRSPYGGAFKVTRGLSEVFPERVLNTPISEAAIVGLGNGLALGGRRPVIEIMFGDFLPLCFDQLVNHTAKFQGMYNERVRTPILVRTPMGGGRGYGPTHSQNLEKHVVGIAGLTTLVLHGRTRVAEMYADVRRADTPILMIENKLLYREPCDKPLPPRYAVLEAGESFATTILRPHNAPDITVVAFGRMSVLAEQAAARLAETEEVMLELIFPLRVWPFDVRPIADSVAQTGKLLVVEEGSTGYDLACEVVTAIMIGYSAAKPLRVRRVGARPLPIPSAIALEQIVLPSIDGLVNACLDLFDE